MQPQRLAITELWLRQIRNISAIDVQPGPRLNVVTGDNGQGKTSLLEAIYLVATSKSFRAERLVEVLQEGAEQGVVRASIAEGREQREQRAVVGPGWRSLALDGKRPESAAAYATRTPVVVFQPGDLGLASGAASGRRTLLDRLALFVDPRSVDSRSRYTRALRERQRALEDRGPSAPELDAYEELLAEHGSALERIRNEVAHHLCQALLPAFERMAAPGLLLAATFRPGGSDEQAELRRQLEGSRARDRARGSASFGPHRDDLELSIDGRSARRHASQGQQRVLALAVKLAELSCIREARGAHPILLLDDVSSELDPERSASVCALLGTTESQVFVTTPRPELFQSPAIRAEDRLDFTVVNGRLEGPLAVART